MAKTLIIYGTTEGQTAKIAQHLADVGRRLGHVVDVVHAPEFVPGSLPSYEGVLVGGSLHEGRYQRDVAAFVREHARALAGRPGGFFSVSLGAISSHADEVAEVQKIMDTFLSEYGWKPSLTANLGGALKYTQYNWLKRALMKHISKKEGGPTDTSRDHEFTDWTQVTQFGERFFGLLAR